ncbi:hypothetical protein F5X68DRAFT_162894 [Plectosphaerella plurivora]|uniref:Polyamine transport protein n=1 Tax=Plectosphaerella plurivora TaxID=936078 RepID=A0A9P8VPA3_9PEZI|nr:hypothetical protein F5X68DRAFT_162894 [Plectosphaerella plurivora]
MFTASRHRSITPDPEALPPTGPPSSAWKRLTTRSYRSVENLKVPTPESPASESSSSSSVRTAILAGPSALQASEPAVSAGHMFSQLFSITNHPALGSGEAALTGDFDETPAPSARPSFENMAADRIKERDGDSLSNYSANRSGAFHHALLKTASGRPMLVDKDLPVPPMLSHEPSKEDFGPKDHQEAEDVELPDPKDFEVDRVANSPSPGRIPISGAIKPDATLERICLDPVALHVTDSHASAHHPGLLKGADFCDAGVAGQPLRQRPFSPAPSNALSSGSSEPEIIHARIDRKMSGGDTCTAAIEVPLPKHHGHSHSTKVRPANDQAIYYRHEDLADGHGPHPAISKVRPFDQSFEETQARTIMENTPLMDSSSSHEGHAHSSKVRHMSPLPAEEEDEEPGFQEPSPGFNPRKYSAVNIADPDDAQDVSRKPSENASSPTVDSSLDYKRTAHWLRNLLKYPEDYTPSLTRIPPRKKRSSMSRGGESPPDTDAATQTAPSRSLTTSSTLPPSVQPMTSSSSDKQAYNDAICDIERSTRYVQVPLRGSSMKQRAEHHMSAGGPLEALPQGSHPSSLGGLSADADVIDFRTQYQAAQHGTRPEIVINEHTSTENLHELPFDRPTHEGRQSHRDHNISLRGKSHVSLQGAQAFSLARSRRRQPIARDWSPARKQFAAIVACVSTAVIGILLGIFAGIIPSIQYYILDTSHLTVYGNVGCFAGMAIPTSNPHQEVVDCYDVRRHGGGQGGWIGIWTFSWIGSLGIGFLVGAVVINYLPPVWGFYISIILVAITLVLNTVCPETRRSTYRRSVAEVNTGESTSRRVARGEVMMHRVKTGPRWWGQEVYHGVCLSFEMLRQPGFLVLSLYVGWIYAQVVLLIILLGSLFSRFYRMKSPYVGLLVASLALGALIGIPFQKANLFSRARYRELNTSRMTLDNKVLWTSHMLRRALFAVGLPVAGGLYTALSIGPPVHPSGPAVLAAAIGCLSCLAISECNGLIMETFDTSDLQPGMTGRPRMDSSDKRTNYSAFPRVTAGLAVCHTFAFIFAAGASALGGLLRRNLGQRAATGVVAGILLILTILLLFALVRFKDVQVVPTCRTAEMDRWTQARRESLKRRASMPALDRAATDPFADDEPYRPHIIGNPVAKTRRVNILELGSKTRWNDIRTGNKLIDASQGRNRDALGAGFESINQSAHSLAQGVRSIVSRTSSERSHGGQSGSRRAPQHGSGSKSEVEMNVLQRPPKTMQSLRGRHGQLPSDGYQERECVMGQALPEDRNEDLEIFTSDASGDDELVRHHGAHMFRSKVMPMYEGPGKGKGD